MRLALLFISIVLFASPLTGQQLSISRISQIPDIPSPYEMRDWKKVAERYDTLLFSMEQDGMHFPLLRLGSEGVNYPEIAPIFLDSYVGSGSHGQDREGINILAALVGASLVGIDKTSQYGIHWVDKARDYYNLKNGELVYLNGPSDRSGHDWWYETMPNIFFYQLYDLYPNTTGFDLQFSGVADRWLEAVMAMGGSDTPWAVPNMNYRAWNLKEMVPLAEGVKEPEAAGAIAWILYQAYKKLGDKKYLIGAQWALEFLDSLESNPSYELQLPYGVLAAAAMNAEVGTSYDIEKMMNWCFDRGDLRGWGSVVGTWGGKDVSGLIGEANDQGNDYAFIMNGYQQAAALVPLIKYDKRFAAPIAKWVLNMANASRLFYASYLNENQQSDYDWSQTHDPHSVIAYEAIKENWQGTPLYARGDAKDNGWGATNFGLYGSSHVGYLAAIIEKTNVEGVLKLDANITNFFGPNPFPTYVLYNPFNELKTIDLNVGPNTKDIYESIGETIILENVSGVIQVTIPAGDVILISYVPAGSELDIESRIVKIGKDILDFHYEYDFQSNLHMKSLAAERRLIKTEDSVTIYCTVNTLEGVTFDWYIDDTIAATDGAESHFIFKPKAEGFREIKAVARTADASVTDSLQIEVVDVIPAPPVILGLTADQEYYAPRNIAHLTAVVEDPSGLALSYEWSTDKGSLSSPSALSTQLSLSAEQGVYQVVFTATNSAGLKATRELSILAVEDHAVVLPLVYLPLDGNSSDYSGNDFEVLPKGKTLEYEDDANGMDAHAVRIFSASDELEVKNTEALNFTDAVSVSCWVSFSDFTEERFVVSHGSWERRWKLSATPDRKLRWTVNTTDAIRDLDSKTLLEKDNWYHVVAIYDSQSMQLILDGALESYTALTGKINPSNVGVTIGKMLPGDDRYYLRGLVDEVKVFNQPLGMSQASTLMNERCSDCIMTPLVILLDDYGKELRVYPNPVIDQVTIQSSFPISEVKIYDLAGGRVSTKIGSGIAYGYQLDLSDLPSGVYTAIISIRDETQSIKIVKQ